jgi:hypothetical protein
VSYGFKMPSVVAVIPVLLCSGRVDKVKCLTTHQKARNDTSWVNQRAGVLTVP